MEESSDSSDLDDLKKKRMKMDFSSQETTPTDTDHVPTPQNPAVGIVFRTDHILEEICSHLRFNDLKQFRVVSRICNVEGRRALIKRDRHWVVVKTKDDEWQVVLGQVLTELEKTASAGGNQTLLGWIFQRLSVFNWEKGLGEALFLRQWGHYLRKIHLETDDQQLEKLTASQFFNTIHKLLTVCCPNLDEMVAVAELVEYDDLSQVHIQQMVDDLEFSSPLLKLKCLRIKYEAEECDLTQEKLALPRFCARLVMAAGFALEKLEIDYGIDEDEEHLEETMLDSLSSWRNVDVSNFQSLQEATLQSAVHVGNLSHTVQKCFPKLTTLIINDFDSTAIMNAMGDPGSYQVFPESFPALKSLIIHEMIYNNIIEQEILYFLQHFPNLEELKVSLTEAENAWPEIPDPVDPIAPRCHSLRSLTFKTEHYDLRILQWIVKFFPKIVRLNLLEFGRGLLGSIDRSPFEPEYSFRELMDVISPLNLSLKHLEVNHAFHTFPQLADAFQITSNLPALETLHLCQAAHDDVEKAFNVSLYLTTSDPDFQYIFNGDSMKSLKSFQLSSFRFLGTQKEVDEVAAKGSHVSTIYPTTS